MDLLSFFFFSDIPRLRMEAIHVTGVDDMSTQDVFGYFKEYPPAHIEWIDDTSCEYIAQTHTDVVLQSVTPSSVCLTTTWSFPR